MTIFNRPFNLILLELEEQVCGKGETRPLIVEAAYRKIIKEYGDILTEEEQVLLKAIRLVMEEIVGRNAIQVAATQKIQPNEAIQEWGKLKFPDWDVTPPEKQVVRIFMAVDEGKAEAAKILYTEGKTVGDSQHKFEVEDAQAMIDKIAQAFTKDILKQRAAL